MTPHTFSSVQAIFGKLRPSKDGETGTIEEDPSGWQGTSDLYLCGYIPTIMLRLWGDFPNIVIGAKLWPEKKVVDMFKNHLGELLSRIQTCLEHNDKVHVFKSLPGLKPPLSKSPPALEKEVAFKNDVYSAKFPRLDLNSGVFTTEIDVIGAGHKVLRNGESVAVTQEVLPLSP